MADEELLAKSMMEHAETYGLPRLERLASRLEAARHPEAQEARAIYRNPLACLHRALSDLTDKE